jgi:Ca2+-binding EF-hand superfamily protein
MVSTATAQDAWRYRSWDRNSDGIITRSEWRGSIQMFRDLDWNGDGMLTGNELRNQGDQGRRTRDEWDAVTFANLDRNNDGRVSRVEWLGDRATFQQVDRNNDNQISRGEFMNANVNYGDFDITDFTALDYDRNGRVDQDEWTGTLQSFRRLDVNGDGELTQRELAFSDEVVGGLDDFASLDYNNDRVISRTEWRTAYGNFSLFDTNRDGVISRNEYSTAGGGGIMRHTIVVDGRQPWTNTGIYVNAGDVVTYQAHGDIQMSTNIEDRATPAGSLSGRNARNSPRPDQKAGGLLLRVGGSSVAFLGENGSFTSQNNGEVVLGINDDHFPDNSGEYRVTLTIHQR